MATVDTTTEILLVDAEGASARCSISRTLWLSLHRQGKTPAPVRLGKRVLWSTAELRAWIAAGCPARETWDKMREDADV